MESVQGLSERLRAFFLPDALRDGEQWCREHLVSELSYRDGAIRGAVTVGNRRFQAIIALGRGKSAHRGGCNCGADQACGHMWALILTFEQWLEREGVATEDHVLGSGDSAARAPTSAPRQPNPAQHTWRNTLGRIQRALEAADGSRPAAAPPPDAFHRPRRQRLAYWVIDFLQSAAHNQFVLMLRQQELLGSGRWGKVKPTHLPAMFDRDFTDPADQELIRFLRRWEGLDVTSHYSSYAYYTPSQLRRNSPTSVSLSPQVHDVVLPMLARTKRLYWMMDGADGFEHALPLSLDQDPVRLKLRVERLEDSACWQLGVGLHREGEPERSLQDLVLLTDDGWILFDNCIARLLRTDVPWARDLRSSGPLQIPFEDRETFLSKLASARNLPELDLPGDLRWEEAAATPSPRLHILHDERTPNLLYGQVWFDYGGERVRHRHSPLHWFDSETNRRISRDMQAEQALFEAARRAARQPDNAAPELADADLALAPEGLTQVVQELNDSRWVVEAEGKRLRRAGEISIAVHSGIDWFDVDARVQFEGTSVALPQLLKALAQGRDTVVLDDGTLGIIADEWLKKYARFGQLAEDEDGRLRFRKSQALLLDALLAAEPSVDWDQPFARLRQRMAKFRGIRQAQPGPKFRGELRHYQQEGLGWLRFLEEFGLGGCLADDMGLGKTVQVLAHLSSRKRRKPGKPSLIVVPKSLVFNWLQEAERFAPRLKIASYTGLERAALREQFAQYDAIVTTYGTMRRDILELKEHEFDYVILDESQAIKNAQSLSAKAARLLHCEHRLAMTGTPIENHLGELWSLFEFLNPGLLGRQSAFQDATRNPDPEDETIQFLSKALAPYILRRTKQQVLSELPDKTEQTIYCELTSKERKYYDELRDYYRTMLDKNIAKQGLKRAKIHVLEALLRLRQAACHPGLIDRSRADESSSKIHFLVEQLKEVIEEGHKALVFSQFTSLLSIVRQQLDSRDVRYEYLDGRTRDRQAKVERFQNDADCRLFLISLKAGGVGLNLTAADYVYILDPWWNPAVESQAIDRTHRIGQTKRVFAYRLITRDTVEEKVLKLQETKRDLADAIIRADEGLMRSLTAEDLQMLLT